MSVVAFVVTLAAVAPAVLAAATARPRLALPASVPVVTGPVVRGRGIDVDLTVGGGWAVVLAAAVLALGAVAGRLTAVG